MRANKFLRVLVSLFSVVVVLGAIFAGWFYWQLRRSLPQLDGSTKVAHLSAAVTVERDALGVPTIRGTTRTDVAAALGFLHAQERFFQMDLSRRSAAGELAELVGEGAVPFDQEARRHGFRQLAQTVLAQAPASHRALIEAYTRGVNAGLSQLRTRPFEYLILRSSPRPWSPEDCVLIAYAMALDLQDATGNYEQSLSAAREKLGSAVTAFFAPLVAPDDAPLDNSTAPLPPIPGPRIIDLRTRPLPEETAQLTLEAADLAFEGTLRPSFFGPRVAKEGSNSFAFTGTRTASGTALLANDMHLNLRVPNTWYRATLVYPANAPDAPQLGTASSGLPPPSETPTERRVSGVTLPGTPLVVAGSNGHIAWGFTNAYADTIDLVVLTASTVDRAFYLHDQRILEVEKRAETIAVKGGKSVTVENLHSRWGPIVGQTAKGQHLALHWTAHHAEATNFDLWDLEAARTAAEALTVAPRAGIPIQNFVVADSAGAIGWTLAGRLPKRVGYDGRLPVTWAFGDRRWDGFVAPEDVPTVLLQKDTTGTTAGGTGIAPGSLASHQLFTANQRLFGGELLNVLGDGGYHAGLRAGRIRTLLSALPERSTPRDLLAVQLDDRADHLDFWHSTLARTLNDDAVAAKKSRRALRETIKAWTGRATPDSASYRVVRSFRRQVCQRVLEPLFEPCRQVYPKFNYSDFRYEAAMRRLVEARPDNFLTAQYPRWDELLLAAADAVVTELDDAGLDPEDATWGRANTASIRHPLSRFLPDIFSSVLDLPAHELPGDHNVPRVQSPSFGASQRFVVTPGREAEGIFHMPAGQSGHPLSPFYRAGHEAWIRGDPTPFVPGPTTHTLTLTP